MWNCTYGASTDKGDVRKENQDSYLCETGEICGVSAALFVVADGMGGLSFGAQVSQFITSQFAKWWQDEFPQMAAAGMSSVDDINELLDQEIWDINRNLLQFNERGHCRAGSTLSLLLLYGNTYFIKNLGDSRIYLFRDRDMRQLTEDQSFVAQMVREKRMTEEEAECSLKKNILTMCMGMFDVPKEFTASGQVRGGDQFLLCSDGLYNCVTRDSMAQIMWDPALKPEDKAGYLRRNIAQGTASDNVTAVVVSVFTEGNADDTVF